MALIQSTGVPGQYYIEGYGSVTFDQWRTADLRDTVQIGGTSITASTQIELFINVQNKLPIDNNFGNNAGRIPAQTEYIVNRIGVLPLQALLNDVPNGQDIVKFVYGAYVKVLANIDRVIEEGPIWRFPSGYGVSGATTENNKAYVTNGPLGSAQVRELLIAQKLGANDQLSGFIQFPARSWATVASGFPITFSVNVAVCTTMEGLQKKGAGA
jgi:hypothetical protein